MKYYILFGPPGAGKGTQASAMVEKYNLCHLSTGELLRKEIAEGTELGKKAKSLIDAGSLVPDEVVEGMKMLAAGNEGVTSVISIMIPDEMIKERIRHRATIEGRADDAKEETINNRIKTYHEKTEPLIDFYKKADKYEEIDGTGSIDNVRESIFSVMDKF